MALVGPTFYLVDPIGNIVRQAGGEGDYSRTEARIRTLLRQAGAFAR